LLNRKPLLIMIIFLFSLLAYFVTFGDASKERERIIENNLDLTANIAKDIKKFIDSHFLIMEIIGGIDDAAYVSRILNQQSSISSFVLTDLDGKVLKEVHKELTGEEQKILFTNYLLPYLQYPLKGEKYVSNVISRGGGSPFIESEDTAQELIVLAAPVYTEDKIIGAVFLTVKSNAFIPLFEEYHIGKNGYAFLRDGSGNTIYHPQHELIRARNYKFFDVSLIPRSDYKVRRSSFDNEKKYMTYRPIENTAWMVFVMQPISEYKSPIYLILLKNGTLLVLLFLFMYLLYHLEQKEKKLLQAQINNERLEVVAEVAAGIAHEIKNPLVPIKGFIQLEKLKANSTLGQETIRLLLSEISRIETIINDFMTLARNNQGQYEQISLLGVLEDVISLMQVEADKKKIQLRSNMDNVKEKILVYGDANHLTQVFQNIIKNSLEATESGGLIEVETRLENKEVRISIRDTGEGMTAEQLRKVGTPFYSTKEQGTGMGLAISQRIIKNHGGRIEIISQEKKGTTVDIYLPY